MRLLIFLMTAAWCWSQAAAPASAPGYRNSDRPNCGSFNTRSIQGIVTGEDLSPFPGVSVEVFDDVSHKRLGKTVTDEAGKFSLGRLKPKRYRAVFYFPGFLPEDWAVTVGRWPEKSMCVTLRVTYGDAERSACRPEYSR